MLKIIKYTLPSPSNIQIEISEKNLPVRPGVDTACELLGLDPLYLANEGKCIVIAVHQFADTLLKTMRGLEHGRDAVLLGTVTELNATSSKGRVIMKTAIGGSRIIGPLSGEPLPRIC